MSINPADKRHASRFEIDCKVQGFQVDPDQQVCAKTHDVSASGLGLVADKNVPIGKTIELELALNGGSKSHVYLSGKVIWARPVAGHEYRLGVQLYESDFKPIPLILKILHNRVTARYNLAH